MRLVLVGLEGSSGEVTLLSRRAFQDRQEALAELGGLMSGEAEESSREVFLMDLDAASPVVMLARPEVTPSAAPDIPSVADVPDEQDEVAPVEEAAEGTSPWETVAAAFASHEEVEDVVTSEPAEEPAEPAIEQLPDAAGVPVAEPAEVLDEEEPTPESTPVDAADEPADALLALVPDDASSPETAAEQVPTSAEAPSEEVASDGPEPDVETQPAGDMPQWPWDVPESALDEADTEDSDIEDAAGLELDAVPKLRPNGEDTSSAVASVPEPPPMPGSASVPIATVVEPLGIAEAATALATAAAGESTPEYEPGALDMHEYTCDDCVYVNTCPNQHQKAPTECGSFQWKSM